MSSLNLTLSRILPDGERRPVRSPFADMPAKCELMPGERAALVDDEGEELVIVALSSRGLVFIDTDFIGLRFEQHPDRWIIGDAMGHELGASEAEWGVSEPLAFIKHVGLDGDPSILVSLILEQATPEQSV